MNREDFGMMKLAIGRFVYYFGFCYFDFRFVVKFHERFVNGKIGKM